MLDQCNLLIWATQQRQQIPTFVRVRVIDTRALTRELLSLCNESPVYQTQE